MGKLKIQKKQELSDFLDSLSKINDAAIVEINKDNNQQLTSLVASEDNTLILLAEYLGIDAETFSTKCNIPDLKKLGRIIDSITKDEIELDINSNHLLYSDDEVKFKYHLYEDGFLQKPSINIEKINNFQYDIEFKLTKASLQSLLRGCAFSNFTNKIYFYTENGTLRGELTDRARHNTDVYCQTLGPVDFELQPTPVNVDNIKLFSMISDVINVGVNTKFGVLVFEISNKRNKLKYIISSLTQ